MNDYTVVPKIGVGPVLFGMAQQEVRGIMPGPFHSFKKTAFSKQYTDGFHENSFQVFYDDNSKVEFIELSSCRGFRAFFGDLNVFETPADKVVFRIEKDAPYKPNDPEIGFSYIFPALELSLWRSSVPESKSDEEGRFFLTIGIGAQGYYSKSV